MFLICETTQDIRTGAISFYQKTGQTILTAELFFKRFAKTFFDFYFYRLICLLILMIPVLNGCATSMPPGNPGLGVGAILEDSLNPLFVQTDDPDYLWESVVDVIDNYFPIANEDPIRKFEKKNENNQTYYILTEGRIDTNPVIASGLLEPWSHNSVDSLQRLEASFQTIRRSAVVRIVPDGSGFLIHLAVYNEIENLPQPMNSNINENNLIFSDDLTQFEYPTGPTASAEGWIPDGRNNALEQHILREIAWRVNNPPSVIHSQRSTNVVP
ncbi:MAG: hypothetical protein Q4C95_06740 [Planctomycetia bacterium]|nr:hypothetical protein [Planctomycetia bacterium]